MKFRLLCDPKYEYNRHEYRRWVRQMPFDEEKLIAVAFYFGHVYHGR